MARSTSTAVAPVEPAAVPDLAPTPASEQIGIEDISLPTLYVAQRTSTAVGEGLAKYGDLFIAQGADDPEAQVMRPFEPESAEGLLFIPLHMHKTWTHSDGENIQSWPYTADGMPPEEALILAQKSGKDVFRTYNYVVLVPDFDEGLPVNLRLNGKSQRPAANKMNMEFSSTDNVWHTHAFRMATAKKEAGGNKWAIPVVTKGTATTEQFESARALFSLILPGLQARQAKQADAASAPAI